MNLHLNSKYTLTYHPHQQADDKPYWETKTGVLREIDGDWLCFVDENGIGFMTHGEDIKQVAAA